MSKELTIQINDSVKELETGRAQALLSQFTPFMEEAAKWEKAAKSIVVTSPEQKEDIKKAHEVRMSLRGIRLNTEKARVSLKEGIVREGKAIDGMSNAIKAVIIPLEDHLQAQEDFVENLRMAEEAKVRQERTELLTTVGMDFVSVDLGKISQADFDTMYEVSKRMKDEKEAAERKLEEERIATLKREEEERERVRQENEKLKAERDTQEKAMAAERAKAEAENKRLREEALAAQRKLEAKELLERQVKAEAERVERLKLEAEESAKKAEAELERKKAMAPDRDKLVVIAERIRHFEFDKTVGQEAVAIQIRVQGALSRMADQLISEANKL